MGNDLNWLARQANLRLDFEAAAIRLMDATQAHLITAEGRRADLETALDGADQAYAALVLFEERMGSSLPEQRRRRAPWCLSPLMVGHTHSAVLLGHVLDGQLDNGGIMIKANLTDAGVDFVKAMQPVPQKNPPRGRVRRLASWVWRWLCSFWAATVCVLGS